MKLSLSIGPFLTLALMLLDSLADVAADVTECSNTVAGVYGNPPLTAHLTLGGSDGMDINIDMSTANRPLATGRVTGSEGVTIIGYVNFPDDKTYDMQYDSEKNEIKWIPYGGGANSFWHKTSCNNEGGVTGDPHFKTWSGEKYDFHGVCDLVLLQDNDFDKGIGLNIHIRTKRIQSKWSNIHTAVTRIGNDTLEVMGGKGENNFWVNLVKGNTTDNIVLSGYPVTFTQLSEKSRQFVIDFKNGEKIGIKTWNGMVSLNLKGKKGGHFENSLGLMGTYPDGMKIARDRTTVVRGANEFGKEWQVLETEPMLFHNIDGPQSPTSCDMPSRTQMRRRLGESLISKKDAELACSRVSVEDFELCVFDVMATNDKDSAGAY